MKQKTITTDKATLLVVECPNTYSLFHDDEWKLIGRVTDIKEENLKEVFGYMLANDNDEYGDYEVFPFYHEDGTHAYVTTNRMQSIHSLLQANEVYFVNPLGDFDSFNKLVFNHSEDRLRDWKEAQSKVWDKERTYLFKKI